MPPSPLPRRDVKDKKEELKSKTGIYPPIIDPTNTKIQIAFFVDTLQC